MTDLAELMIDMDKKEYAIMRAIKRRYTVFGVDLLHFRIIEDIAGDEARDISFVCLSPDKDKVESILKAMRKIDRKTLDKSKWRKWNKLYSRLERMALYRTNWLTRWMKQPIFQGDKQ
jgi:hypothetical protein